MMMRVGSCLQRLGISLTIPAGPLELTRRQKVLVWDDEVEVTPENIEALSPPVAPPMHQRVPSAASMPPRPSRQRSASISNVAAPPMRRTSTDDPRPVPFARSFARVHPATTGVAVLEQMEHIDRVEAKLQRGPQRGRDVEEGIPEEADVGEAVTPRPIPGQSRIPSSPKTAPLPAPASPRSPHPLPALQELAQLEEAADHAPEEDDEDDEVDLAALSKSMPHLDETPSNLQARWTSTGDGASAPHPFDLFTPERERKTVIVERLEPVTAQPLFSWVSSF
jgi:phosphatidylinositol 4-kinase type 2